jgi:TolB-like protein
MSDVFVSYKAEDRRRVKPLVEALEADGYSVWWDEQIGGGTAWRHSIEAELNAAKCVIVAWSKRSIGPEGTFVQDEATRAQQRHVYVPVLIDKVHLPLGFGETQALPLAGWRGNKSDPHYQAVLETVRRITGRKRRASAPRKIARAPVSRRAVIGSGAVAAVAVAAAGGWELLKPSSASASDSIAVLPFENLSGDPAQAYFSDGIAEEIRSALARLGGLTVIGRTSSEAVRNDDTPTAAKKLGVASILTGSVRQSSSTMRITAELVDGRTGADRWSQDYDRPPGDSIKIQSDIAANVAGALSSALGMVARKAIQLGGTQNPKAQKLLLEAGAVPGGSRVDAQHRLDLMNQATALDPNYADAYARKSLVLSNLANTFANGVNEIVAYRAQSLQAAQTAIRLAPNLAASHRALGAFYRGELNLAAAFAQFKLALKLAPGDTAAIGTYSAFVSRLGHADEALRLADQAIALDPINDGPYGNRAYVLMGGRRYAEVVRFSKDVQRNTPQLFYWPENMALALLLLGQFDAAQQYLDIAPADSYYRLVYESALLVRTGRSADVPPRIAKIRQLYGDAASYQYAEICAQLGDGDQAFAALDHAWQIHDAGLLNLKVDPMMDPLRADPRFAALLRKMNFPA